MNNIILTVSAMTAIYLPCYLYIRHARRKAKKESEYNRPRADIKPYTPPPPRPKPKAASKPKQTRKCKVSPETLEAMHLQADAEMHIAEALKARAEKERDPVKKAGLEKRAALAWVRFCSILDKAAAIEESSD